MPSPINYSITLSPAEIKNGGVSHMLYDPRAVKEVVTADTLGSLESRVRTLAAERFPTDHVVVYVGLPRGQRKPNGFEAARNRFQTIRNDKAA